VQTAAILVQRGSIRGALSTRAVGELGRSRRKVLPRIHAMVRMIRGEEAVVRRGRATSQGLFFSNARMLSLLRACMRKLLELVSRTPRCRCGRLGSDRSRTRNSLLAVSFFCPKWSDDIQEGNPKIRQLFGDVRTTEQNYCRQTGLFLIMHVVSLRADAVKADPGLPRAVVEMYEAAKQMAYADLTSTTSLGGNSAVGDTGV
jgi:hypothetical protein